MTIYADVTLVLEGFAAFERGDMASNGNLSSLTD